MEIVVSFRDTMRIMWYYKHLNKDVEPTMENLLYHK